MLVFVIKIRLDELSAHWYWFTTEVELFYPEMITGLLHSVTRKCPNRVSLHITLIRLGIVGHQQFPVLHIKPNLLKNYAEKQGSEFRR